MSIPAEDTGTGPTMPRILLGNHLRRLRENAGIPARDAGYEIRASESNISRIELGRMAVKVRDLDDLLTLYGCVDPGEREQVVWMARQAMKPGWWQRYRDILPDWFDDYLGLETAARLIRIHETRFVPDLLQTLEYAAAVLALADLPPHQADRHVLLREDRQRRFDDGRVRIWAIIDEAALRRPIGSEQVLLGQLRRLLDATSAPNLTLQIIPRDTPYLSPGPFNILRFPEPELPDLAYVENLVSALCLDTGSEVEEYLIAMDRLGCISASPDETCRILKTIINQIEDDDRSGLRARFAVGGEEGVRVRHQGA